MSGLNLAEFEQETVNLLLSALSDEYNRIAVNFFRESPEMTASLDDLVEYVAEHQDERDTSSPAQVAVKLHHSGLPKLAETGVLDYDPRSNRVRCWDHPVVEADEIDDLIEAA